MNDQPTGGTPESATPEMLEAVSEGEGLLGTAEDCFDKLAVLCNKGFKLGMMDKVERDELANIAKAIKHQVLAYHSRLTGVAIRNKADGALKRGGPGR